MKRGVTMVEIKYADIAEVNKLIKYTDVRERITQRLRKGYRLSGN